MSLPAAFVHENEKADSLYSSHGPSAPELLGSPGGAHVQSRGVTRMEAMQRAARGSSGKVSLWIIIISLCICAWAYALDQSTTSSFNPFATSSFKDHSGGLSALSVATGIMSAVSKPFIAKIADITSRPYTYIFILAFYVVGYIIVACSPSLAAYVIGQVMRTIGSSGLNLLNSIIVADLTTLEWRGFVNAILSAPFLINVWFSGEIVNALGTSDKWRWGYGMFAIIMPACIGPAIVALVYLDRKAHKQGQIGLASSDAARRAALEATAEKGGHIPDNAVAAPPTALDQQRWLRTLKTSLIEIDAIGLILLGFAWSLILLPFSLQATAKGGWRNPSMIAMIVVGGIILILYGFYERFVAPMPSFPRRLVLNKTFMMAIIIDMFYFIAFYLEDLYLSSYTYIITPWSLRSWNYFSNTLTLSLCFFALIAGIIQRWTHRYKYLQTFGLCVKIIGIGILLNGSGATKSVASLVMSQILIGMGGSFSVIGSQVASQASVPHQDVAIAIAQLALWTYIGGSIGSAIAAPIWAAKMPSYLREFLPANITDEQVQAFYEDIRTIRDYDWDSPVRQGAVEAYRRTLYYLLVPALALAFIPLIASFFQTNYYLGKQQNAVTSVALDGSKLHELGSPSHDVPDASNLTFKQKFLRFWS